MEAEKVPMTGENFRKTLMAIKTFDLPLLGKFTINANHTVNSPVYLMEVKDGKWGRLALVE
jgi:branched-chain amino acid transport system substrate-binding protein